MSAIKNEVIIRFSHVAEQPSKTEERKSDSPIRRLVGFSPAKHLIPLFDNLSLDANPRSSRRNHVVQEILISLAETPELFRYKSKGILLGTANYEELDRQRYRLILSDPSIEGILDGGHNMLAIGLHILAPIMDEKAWLKVRSWDDLREAWSKHRDLLPAEGQELDFLVPVELLVPSDEFDDVDAFLMPLLEVCQARNNNAQLPIEASSNKQGFYDAIKEEVNSEFAKRVEWKPNSWEAEDEKRPIKVRDLVALAWIPLNLLNEKGALPLDISVSAQNTYRNKGECSRLFEKLMSDNAITEATEGAKRKLHHDGVRSAFAVLAELPTLYDAIYQHFPSAYNSEKRRFGANPIVKTYDPARRDQARQEGKDTKGYTSVQPTTPFFRNPVRYKYPDGLIMPIVYGLQGLMVVENGIVKWSVSDPQAFVQTHLSKVADSYHLVLNMAKWDPQKISKDPSSYEWVTREWKRLASSS